MNEWSRSAKPRLTLLGSEIKYLANMLARNSEFQAAYLYPVFSGRKCVFVGIVPDKAKRDVFIAASRQYDEVRHPPDAQPFTAEKLRVYELQRLVDGLTGWLKGLPAHNMERPLLHDALLLPPDWQSRCEDLEKQYYSPELGFISKLVERDPVIVFER